MERTADLTHCVVGLELGSPEVALEGKMKIKAILDNPSHPVP